MSSSSPAPLAYKKRLDLSKPRYDQATYFGRVRHFFAIINPMTLFTSKETLQRSLDILSRYESGANMDEETVWEAKRVKDAIVHPDTKKPIFWMGRMAAFVPLNVPLVFGMLTASSPLRNIFWQWANQTYNVCVNYANRNASNNMSNEQVAAAYGIAVASSCGLSVALSRVVKNIKKNDNIKPFTKTAAGIAVPFLSVATAGALNVLTMRYTEGIEGVNVMDSDGNVVGTSVAAGRKGLFQVALTRIFLPAPILIGPELIMMGLFKTRWARNSYHYELQTKVGVITLCLWAALPLAIGLFPQVASMPVSKMEEKFQNLRDNKGNKIDTLYFNKGL